MDLQVISTVINASTLLALIVGLIKIGRIIEAVETHTDRLNNYEKALTGVVSDVQRLIGATYDRRRRT